MPILGITMDTVTMQPRLTRPGIAMGIVGFYPSLQVHAGVWCLVFVCLCVGLGLCVCVCQIVIAWDCETDLLPSIQSARSSGLKKPDASPPGKSIWPTFSLRKKSLWRAVSRAFMHRSSRPLATYRIIQLLLYSLNIATTYFNHDPGPRGDTIPENWKHSFNNLEISFQ